MEGIASIATSVEEAVGSRLSCRAFLRDKPVARGLVEEVLKLASRAPSGSNHQPWRVYALEGAARDSLCDKVCAAHDAVYRDPSLAAGYREDFDYYARQWVPPYIDRRRENGWGLYGLLGIVRGEKDKMHAQHQRNFRFFDAPLGLMFTIDRVLGRGSLMDYGMFLQNIMLLARAKGLQTCPQAAWDEFATIVKPHIGAGPQEMLLCGMAIGYGDPGDPVNGFHTPREPVEAFARWVSPDV